MTLRNLSKWKGGECEFEARRFLRLFLSLVEVNRMLVSRSAKGRVRSIEFKCWRPPGRFPLAPSRDVDADVN